ncbi:hypothetical protein GDO86_008977 [Hymenochirus boettgeri]|uniref:S1 motif domain-containing protein n=1 Tax=Hymenochirus boettgeri TaxID=247094 RepID=A0A8T2JH40_9PIPI|nr:hypothetical protein GDO86_008977 [Hymenochirus boettgeri]
MAGLPRRAKQNTLVAKQELSFMSVSDSEEDHDIKEEDEWKPEKKAPKAKTKANSTTGKPRKVPAKRSTTKTKGEGAVRRPRKAKPMELDANIINEGLQDPTIKQEKKTPKKSPVKKRKSENSTTGEIQIKEERRSLGICDFPSTSSLNADMRMKKEEPAEEEPPDDFTFGEPPLKMLKLTSGSTGKATKRVNSSNVHSGNEMNWDLAEVLAEKTNTELWVCSNLIRLFQDENTIPFIARYRKELINNLDADAIREVHQGLEELRSVEKKANTVIEKLKKEGKLNGSLHAAMLNCKSVDEIEHVYAPFKTGSKGTKAQRARQLGLEAAATGLIETPAQLNLFSYIKNNVEAVDVVYLDFAKAFDTVPHRRLMNKLRCKENYVTIHSTLAKATGKEKEGNQKDVDKFHLYQNFTCNITRIQHHQILAINRGENLKILTVKVNVPDRVKDAFCRWCVNERWRPKQYARPELMKILHNSVDDSYKRLIYPLLCREYRSKLTSDAEKESVMMFGRNLRQLLLANPVRGRTIMGVDPGYKHGCKLAIISTTSDCYTVAIGNGTACRETERYFADLIQRRFFAPLDVVYCITNEAGASIYSVSPEAAKEMPGLDPNLRSAVSIARRVQDPLAELVKIEPKHIGVGMYQHDVSQTLLKGTLDSVVEECVSFVGVDINICSETLLRHIAGLNATRAKNIIEWREKSGPFINREQLKLVKGLGPKSFQQCAGFIRMNQEYIRNFCREQLNPGETSTDALKSSKPGKKAGKTAASVSSKPNPLDQTCIHPESYNIAIRFLSLVGGNTDDIGTQKIQDQVNKFVQQKGIDDVAQKLNTTVHTLQIIIDGLCHPEGFDIRTEFDKTDFKTNIVCLEDLKIGTILTGKVENATLFGVFVDIGVGKAGLIPMRYISEAKLSKEKRRRSLGLGPGERVEVKVINIDIKQSRITLELLRVL